MSKENERCGICILRDSCIWKTTMNGWCTKYQSRHEVTTATDSVAKTCKNCNSGGVGLTCQYCTGRNAWQPTPQPVDATNMFVEEIVSLHRRVKELISQLAAKDAEIERMKARAKNEKCAPRLRAEDARRRR
jgi:hypothetical protein